MEVISKLEDTTDKVRFQKISHGYLSGRPMLTNSIWKVFLWTIITCSEVKNLILGLLIQAPLLHMSLKNSLQCLWYISIGFACKTPSTIAKEKGFSNPRTQSVLNIRRIISKKVPSYTLWVFLSSISMLTLSTTRKSNWNGTPVSISTDIRRTSTALE